MKTRQELINEHGKDAGVLYDAHVAYNNMAKGSYRSQWVMRFFLEKHEEIQQAVEKIKSSLYPEKLSRRQQELLSYFCGNTDVIPSCLMSYWQTGGCKIYEKCVTDHANYQVKIAQGKHEKEEERSKAKDMQLSTANETIAMLESRIARLKADLDSKTVEASILARLKRRLQSAFMTAKEDWGVEKADLLKQIEELESQLAELQAAA